jgi:hypothetical protein
MVTYEQYLTALREPNVEVVYKIELLDKNENVIDDITEDLIDCSVTMTMQNGQRRSATLTLVNLYNKYTPNVNGYIWLDKKIRMWSGIKVNSEDYLFSHGIFVIYEPDADSHFSDTKVTLALRDKWSYLNGDLKGTLKNDYIIAVGSNIGNAVRDIIVTEAKEVKPPIIVPTTVTSPYTLTINRGDTYADMLIKLSEMISYNLYFDSNGILRFEPDTNDNLKPIAWNFGQDEISYQGSNRRYEFYKVKNSVYIFGDNVNGSQCHGEAQDSYIFSNTKVDLIDERVLVIEDDIIYTNDLCQQRANYELKKAVLLNEVIDTNCITIPHLNEGDIVTIEDDGNGLERDRRLIQNITLPLKYDTQMQVNLWQVRQII